MAMTPPKILTIGAFGASAEAFFQALLDAHVDTFVDIRSRRGVRGSEFAFVNSQRLQSRLGELGISYLHIKELAPTNDIRQAQKAQDARMGVAKRKRDELGAAFRHAYSEGILKEVNTAEILHRLPAEAKVIALFCVERAPAACHRSLAAEKLSQAWGSPVEHLLP